MDPQTHSPFFDLPPELRDMIYTEVFKDITVVYDRNSFEEVEPEGILLSCKRLFEESKEVHHKTSTFDFDGIDMFLTSFERDSPKGVHIMRKFEIEIYAAGDTFSLDEEHAKQLAACDEDGPDGEVEEVFMRYLQQEMKRKGIDSGTFTLVLTLPDCRYEYIDSAARWSDWQHLRKHDLMIDFNSNCG